MIEGRRSRGGGWHGVWPGYGGWYGPGGWSTYRGWSFGYGIGYPWGWYGYGPWPPSVVIVDHGGVPGAGPVYEAAGALDLNIKPKSTEVYVDGEFVGTAGRFDGFPDYLWLSPGSHELVLYREGYRTLRREVTVRSAWILDLRVALERGASTDPATLRRPSPAPEEPAASGAWRRRDG